MKRQFVLFVAVALSLACVSFGRPQQASEPKRPRARELGIRPGIYEPGPLNALSKEDLIRVADQALYVAKNNGRDRVALFNYQLITR